MKENTSQLASEICRMQSMDGWEKKHDDELIEEMSLSEFLDQLLLRYAVRKNEIIRRANLDTTYGYQIFQGKKKTPSREKLLRLALAWPLTVDETKRLLYYGKAETLYPRVRRDAYLMYAIHNRFTVLETDQYLYEHGEPTLG
ncbi:MAG: hypothetical protein IKQ97_07985 [Eubacterium sp.]|nr:hypothetical protein [Eubacterium sp.]